MTLQLTNLIIHDRHNKALFNPVSFEVKDGEVFTLIGPSGCGKSTLLSAIAGHLSDDFSFDGEIQIEGKDVGKISPHLRRVGFLFQDDLLFPHLNIWENLAFALPNTMKGQARSQQLAYMLKKLEDALGQQLFSRTSQTTQLPPEGLLILEDVREILRLCENIKIKSNCSAGVVEGHIRIAAIHSVGMYELGDFLSGFMKAFPKVYVHLEYEHSEAIYEAVRKEQIDIGIVAYPKPNHLIESIPFSEDELVLVAGKKHKLNGKKSVSISQLKGEPFVAFGERIRVVINKLLAEKDIDVNIRMTHNNVYTLKKAVEAEIGVSILPNETVKEEITKGKLHKINITDINSKRPLSIIRLASKDISTPLEVFIKELLSFAQK
jgi:DNA-binding transcriptional LysR family regulator